MSFSLKSSFLSNSRGFTFEDANGIAWSFNPSTNQITASYTGGGSSGSANPAAKVGLSAVNGSAATFMRSDAAPPLDPSISPTWTGNHVFGNIPQEKDSAGGGPFNIGFLGWPFNPQFSKAYTLVLSDRGKAVGISTGQTCTVPSGVFAAGDLIVIITSGTGAVTIAPASGVTMFFANGTTATGNRTLTGVGMAFVYFNGSNTCYIGGFGLT